MLLQQLHDLVFVMSLGKLERIHTLFVKPSKVNTLFNQKFNCFEATLFDCVKEWSLSVASTISALAPRLINFSVVLLFPSRTL